MSSQPPVVYSPEQTSAAFLGPDIAPCWAMTRNAVPTPPGDSPQRLPAGYEPDILAKGLDAVFCGINPAASAEAAGHNFSHGSNRFWRVLHLARLTDVQLRPCDERRLLEYRYGITAVVRRATARAEDVSPLEFRLARSGFEAKMRRYAPRVIAFLGKRAFTAMADQADVPWGRQAIGFAGTTAWVLPNPSGLNRSFTLDSLVEAYSELRIWLAR